MAGANWDTIAFDNDGKPTEGSFTHPQGSFVEIRKNRIYVGDNKLWRGDCASSFCQPYIASIDSGSLSICGFTLEVARDEKQNAVFVYAEYIDRSEDIYQALIKRFGGIGCYAFMHTTPIYVEKMKLDPAKDWVQGSMGLPDGTWKPTLASLETYEEVDIPKEIYIEDTWIGVTEKTLETFFKWLEGFETNGWAEKIRFDNKQIIK